MNRVFHAAAGTPAGAPSSQPAPAPQPAHIITPDAESGQSITPDRRYRIHTAPARFPSRLWATGFTLVGFSLLPPPLGEAEWRGGVGVGSGWASREGDENDAAVGPRQPSTAAPYRRRSASGKRPPPPLGLRPSRPSPPLASRAGGGRRCAPPTF